MILVCQFHKGGDKQTKIHLLKKEKKITIFVVHHLHTHPPAIVCYDALAPGKKNKTKKLLFPHALN